MLSQRTTTDSKRPRSNQGMQLDCLQPTLRCVATRGRDGRTPSKPIRTRREVPGNRTLRHPGAPTQTCYGVIHSAKLWGQCTKRWEPHSAKGEGRVKRMNICEGLIEGS